MTELSQAEQGIIFINYRRTDAGWPADHLATELKRAFGDDRVFLDVRNIDAGGNFTDEIEEQVRQATVLLVAQAFCQCVCQCLWATAQRER